MFLRWGCLSALLVVALFAPGPAAGAANPPPAQSPGQSPEQSGVPLKIAILDVDRVLRSAAAVKDIQDKLRQYRETYRSEIQREEDEIRAAHQVLGDTREDLLPKDYDERQRSLNERVSRAQAMMQNRRRKLDEARAAAMSQVQNALNAIVAEIATERMLTMILRKDQTVLAATQLEITDEVLRRLDGRLPAVNVEDLHLEHDAAE